MIPSRTDTKYFHKLLKRGGIIVFIKGRLKFSNKGSAPFPNIIFILDTCYNENVIVKDLEDIKHIYNLGGINE